MRDLSTFLRERRAEILARWERAVRALPSARALSHDRLTDFLPALLERIADDVEAAAKGAEMAWERPSAEHHAQHRLENRYTLGDIIEELSYLRDTIIEMWGGDGPHQALNRAIDRSILASVDAFLSTRRSADDAFRTTEARLRFLAKAGTLLSSSLDYQETLDHVSQMVVPEFADWCAVDVLRPDGTLGDFVAVAHADPEKADAIREMRRRHPASMDGQSGVPVVIRTERPLLVERVDEGWLDRYPADDPHRELLIRLRVQSLLVVPLRARDVAFGALVLANVESGRCFTPADLEFAEELAGRAAAAIDNARLYEESRKAVEVRDRILAVVSHDLRNPLGAIDLGAALLLKNERIRSEPIPKKQVEAIQRSAHRMDRLISDLLDMSSIQAGQLSLRRELRSVRPLLVEAVEGQEPAAREKGIRIRRSFDVGNQVRALCDYDRFLQVLSNLLGNGIKFCGAGDELTLSAKIEKDQLLMSVVDTGPGMDDEEVERVFELYWHGKGREHRGTGLGLFIARGIVEAHGGRLWVESRPGAGSTFFLTLPLARSPSAEPSRREGSR